MSRPMTPYHLCKKAFRGDPGEHPAGTLDSVIYQILFIPNTYSFGLINGKEIAAAVAELKLIADLADIFCGKSCDESVRLRHAE